MGTRITRSRVVLALASFVTMNLFYFDMLPGGDLSMWPAWRGDRTDPSQNATLGVGRLKDLVPSLNAQEQAVLIERLV